MSGSGSNAQSIAVSQQLRRDPWIAIMHARRTSAFQAPMQLPSKVSASRIAAEPVMAAKKSVGKKSTTEGKGGIFPWVTNTPGSKCEPHSDSAQHSELLVVDAARLLVPC